MNRAESSSAAVRIARAALVRAAGPLLAACVFACGTAPAARAQGSVALRWNACEADGATQVVPPCDTNAGEYRLALSIASDNAITQVSGWAIVLDIAVDTDPATSWWQMQPGGCRQGALLAVMPLGNEGACLDAWSTTGAAVVQSVIYPRPGGDGSQLRVVAGMSVPAAAAFDMAAGVSHLAAVLSLRLTGSTGPGLCPGCLTPACLVFNSVEIDRLPGAPGGAGPIVLDQPMPLIGNQVVWRAGTSCGPVPVRNRTWGQLKVLYR